MATVCKWLGFYLCMKEPELPVIDPIDYQKKIAEKCDLVVTWKAESPKEKSGGLSFEVILEPPVTLNPPAILREKSSPTKDISLSAEEIEKKLKEAEERRLSAEITKLTFTNKSKDRAVEVSQRLQDLNESFCRGTEKKLAEKMEANADKKNAKIKALQERLREHAGRVEEVCALGEKYKEELRERIERKLETAEGNREAHLKNIQEHIQKHEKHIQEVMEQSSKFSRDTEEKLIQKMERSVQNRDKKLNQLMLRLQDHERHVEKVRLNKMNLSTTEDLGLDDSSRRLSGSSDDDFDHLSDSSSLVRSHQNSECSAADDKTCAGDGNADSDKLNGDGMKPAQSNGVESNLAEESKDISSSVDGGCKSLSAMRSSNGVARGAAGDSC